MKVLAVTGGHRVDLGSFQDMLAAICAERGWVFAHAVQPDAQRWLTPEHHGKFDAILCHDLPGLALRRGAEPTPVGPDDATRRALLGLLALGQGFVFLHHALAGWPGWDTWAEVLGGRYHYAPAPLRGQHWPDSGFRYARYTARPEPHIEPHAVTAGLEPFVLDDELYQCPVFEDDVVVLLRAVDAVDGAFRETYREVLGTPRRDADPPWYHPPTSDAIGWAKTAGTSPLVYLQPGDGPSTFAHPNFRRLLGNALAWVASAEAHDWAGTRPDTTREGIAWISS